MSRDVAIKVLLPPYADDARRLRLFAEEARATGALNHPNILTVYDVGEHHGTPFLVAECLEGHSLRSRIAEGPVPAEQTVAVALGIARGLGAAHGRGFVHRDLKPENVFLRSDGGVKILDFGLAKLQSTLQSTPDNTADPSHSLSSVIAGTAAYMSPEQIMSGRVDGRTDLFALGIILYEMLEGRHPFRRASVFETMDAVLTVDLPTVGAANDTVPDALARIVMRLLARAPEARFQSALDLEWALAQVPTGQRPGAAGGVHRAAPASGSRFGAAAWVAAATLAAGLLGVGWQLLPRTRESTPVSTLTQFAVPLPSGVSLASAPAVSPEGQHIAFTGTDAAGGRLYVRALASREAVVVAGTEGASRPFWSADGSSIGFFAEGSLKTVAWPGGAPLAIAPAPFPYGGSWSTSGDILFAPDVIPSGLTRVSADGRTVTPATRLDIAAGDTAHWWPVFLSNGRDFLYHVRSTVDDRIGVHLGQVGRPAFPIERALLFRSESDVSYVPLPGTNGGVLLSVAEGRIEARRLDEQRLAVAADARALGLSAGGTTVHHGVLLSASPDVLAFAVSSVSSGDRIETLDRRGEVLRRGPTREVLNWPRLSRDQGRLAMQRVDGLRNNPDIWVEDLERQTSTRVTMAAVPDIQPVWSPDGRRLAYMSGALPGRSGDRVLSIAATDGTGGAQTFPCPAVYCEPTDWSLDGRQLLINVRDGKESSVWTFLPESGAAQPLLSEAFAGRDARFSPNGQWIAYTSEESGRTEVSVRALSGPSTRVVLSSNGGDQPVWRRDGAELFYVEPTGYLQSVPVRWTPEGTPSFGLPVRVNVPPIGFGHWGTQYDVSADGTRIYALRRNTEPAPREIHVVIGWRTLLD